MPEACGLNNSARRLLKGLKKTAGAMDSLAGMRYFLAFRLEKAVIQNQKLRLYEEILVLHPDASESERREICAATGEMAKAHGGKAHHIRAWGSRPLANPGAKGVSRGWYFHTLFSAGPGAVQELRRRLRINSRVVYFHHEKLPEHETPDGCLERFSALLERSEAEERERIGRIQKRQGFGGRRPESGRFRRGFSGGGFHFKEGSLKGPPPSKEQPAESEK